MKVLNILKLIKTDIYIMMYPVIIFVKCAKESIKIIQNIYSLIIVIILINVKNHINIK